jgi:tetratricopeptide (TPR) repeat protein
MGSLLHGFRSDCSVVSWQRAPTRSPAKSTAPADVLGLRGAMYEVLKLNPRFAPAWVELAFANARQGNLAGALALARKAEELEPSRAGYHLLAGKILVDLGREEEAAKVSSFVAERWRGPDHNEALELWNRIPIEKRPQDTSVVEEIAADTKAAEGTLVSITCSDKGPGPTVLIQNSDGTLKFRSGGLRTIGYSDTLWYGTDHFSACHHLAGMRAVVRYKAAPDKESAGEWVDLELREDLPGSPDKKAATPADTKK